MEKGDYMNNILSSHLGCDDDDDRKPLPVQLSTDEQTEQLFVFFSVLSIRREIFFL